MSARYWLLRDGTTRMRIKAETIEAARERAAGLGLRDPDSIVLLDDAEAWTAMCLSRAAQPSPWFVARRIGDRLTGHYEQLRNDDGSLARFDDKAAAQAAIERTA
jgi:hypothetical protein